MDVMQAIKERRSIRKYLDKAIPEDLLNTVLDATHWAPSWANTQCPRFVVVKDPNTKAALAEALSKDNPATEAVRNAPVVIVACAEVGKSGCFDGQPVTDKGDCWFMFDVGLAMQNLALAAYSLGLGTVNIANFDAKQVEALLQVPQGIRVVDMTPLGYPEGPAKGSRRKELSEIVFHEKYGQL